MGLASSAYLCALLPNCLCSSVATSDPRANSPVSAEHEGYVIHESPRNPKLVVRSMDFTDDVEEPKGKVNFMQVKAKINCLLDTFLFPQSSFSSKTSSLTVFRLESPSLSRKMEFLLSYAEYLLSPQSRGALPWLVTRWAPHNTCSMNLILP